MVSGFKFQVSGSRRGGEQLVSGFKSGRLELKRPTRNPQGTILPQV